MFLLLCGDSPWLLMGGSFRPIHLLAEYSMGMSYSGLVAMNLLLIAQCDDKSLSSWYAFSIIYVLLRDQWFYKTKQMFKAI